MKNIDYIKKKDAMTAVSCYMKQTGIAERPYTYASDEISKLPSADVIERKHGHWEWGGRNDYIGAHGASCSVCGQINEENGEYCSWCGARMDDEIQREIEAEEGGYQFED